MIKFRAMKINHFQKNHGDWENFDKDYRLGLDYRLMYENAPDMYLSVNPENGKIIGCNNTLFKKTGFTKAEVLNKTVFYIYDPSCHEEVREALETFRECGRLENQQLMFRTKAGGVIPILLSVEAVRDGNGNIMYSNGCCRDISDRYRLQQEINQFAYVASHDLQAPLKSVKGALEVFQMMNQNIVNEESVELLKVVDQSLDRMTLLIEGLLEHSQIGKSFLKEKLDMNGVVGDVLVDLASSIESSGAKVVYGYLPEVEVYPVEIRLLFQNLIGNAIKFQKKGKVPMVAIEFSESPKYFQFVVSDNGIGIPEHQQSAIFRMFSRLNSPTDFEGTGIGLAHCKKIVELHGGEIWLNSDFGMGSQFYFTLPKS
ncbi:hypothetical protein PEDI_12760 [Persicobacter diffluens]|uniref:histidine kinase n=2 Tax=Persicobacter diffluens TaxID=981 RepID=A0AAN4VWX1_9BACT|nr:hypothetical protein PEDI_12760 [Persicobacter diffluens]